MKTRIPLFVTIFTFAAYLFAQAYYGPSTTSAAPSSLKQKKYNHYQKQLREITFTDLEGKKYNFKRKVPKVVILNFWASWCTPCIEEFPSIVKLQDRYKDNKNFIFLGINADDEDVDKKIKKVTKRYGLNFPIIKDIKGKLIDRFNISAIPVTIIFYNGKIVDNDKFQGVSNGSRDFFSEELLAQLKKWDL